MPDAFEAILPSAITDAPVLSGSEWAIPLPQAKQAIDLASEHWIAVLGVESFRIQEKGFRVESYTGYDFEVEFTALDR
jgi:hypothetical protein